MLSQREAASQWHLSRARIQRAIKAGKLSLTPDKAIDPAEMLRVFGEPSRLRSGPMEPPGTTHEPAPDPVRDARIAALEATIAAQAKHIESLDRAMLLLGNDRPPRPRRWWQLT